MISKIVAIKVVVFVVTKFRRHGPIVFPLHNISILPSALFDSAADPFHLPPRPRIGFVMDVVIFHISVGIIRIIEWCSVALTLPLVATMVRMMVMVTTQIDPSVHLERVGHSGFLSLGVKVLKDRRSGIVLGCHRRHRLSQGVRPCLLILLVYILLLIIGLCRIGIGIPLEAHKVGQTHEAQEADDDDGRDDGSGDAVPQEQIGAPPRGYGLWRMEPPLVQVRGTEREDAEPNEERQPDPARVREESDDGAPAQAEQDLVRGEAVGGIRRVQRLEAEAVRAQLAPSAVAVRYLQPAREAVLVTKADGTGALARGEERPADGQK